MSIGVKKKLIFVIVFAAVLVLGLGAAFFLKPKEKEVQLEKNLEKNPIQQETWELICMVETKEEAEKLADAYGIELIKYNEKVAVFQTDKSAKEIIEIGKEKDLPELSANNIVELY